MCKKKKKHEYADRLKYMHLLEEGHSIKYILRPHSKRERSGQFPSRINPD